MKDVNLAIAMPTNFPMIYTDVFDAFMTLERPSYTWIHPNVGSIEDMRNQAVYVAQKYECTHLLMFDADMVLHPKTITKLLENDLDICGALCYQRYWPFNPVMFKVKTGNFNGKMSELHFDIITKFEENTIIELDAIGTGVFMVKMEVFEKLKQPYFEKILKGVIDKNEYYFGEDISFCIKCKQVGLNIYMDSSIPCGHISKHHIRTDDHKLASWINKQQSKIKQEVRKQQSNINNFKLDKE